MAIYLKNDETFIEIFALTTCQTNCLAGKINDAVRFYRGTKQ